MCIPLSMFCTTLLQWVQYWQKEKGPFFLVFYSQVLIANTRSDNVMFLNHLASNITLCKADPNLHEVKWQDLGWNLSKWFSKLCW